MEARGGEYWYLTHGIEYTVRHHEDPFPTCGIQLPCPPTFLVYAIDDNKLRGIPCRLQSKEDYYQTQQRQFKARLHSYYPHLSRGCTAKITESFMEIVHIANGTHFCIECQPDVPFSFLHIVFVRIQPHHEAAAFLKADGPPRWPATRASVVELLSKASSTTAEEEEVCAICMERMQLSKKLPMPCFHSFHQICLLPWLDDNHFCPLCRYQLPRAQYRSLE